MKLGRTSLIVAELKLLVEVNFIRIHLGIKTIVLLKHACQATCSRVHSTPMCDALLCIDFRHNVFKVALAK